MEFVPSLDTYSQDGAAQLIWGRLSAILNGTDGICYYKHPVIRAAGNQPPDLALLAEGHEPVIIKCLNLQIEDIRAVDEHSWNINGEKVDSPFLQLDDYIAALQGKYNEQRSLRRLLHPEGVLALPLIAKASFEDKFGTLQFQDDFKIIWSNLAVGDALVELKNPLEKKQWLLAKSVFQGVHPLNKATTELTRTPSTLGGAIKILERDIALLDEEQHKVAVQLAPGPQRIRGLAGTGKTVVLAKKAANIHQHYPEKRILFTFNTQSLYNQTKALITKFYRAFSDEDPDWNFLHIRHGWGGSNRPGVYYDLCTRQNLMPLTFKGARNVDFDSPFRVCCKQVLGEKIQPYYDFILVDEAQDFPQEFFPVLAKLATPEPRRIYFAYDELQSLSSIEIPRAEDLFGRDEAGNPYVSLEGEDYPGGIEKDFVLHRSYRCPMDVLMLAHGIGLGVHGPHGCVQMLESRASWQSIGYEVVTGDLVKGEDTVICRPTKNSPNRIEEIYTGKQKIIRVKEFDDRDSEMEWVAESIKNDILKEEVAPDQIVVISLDTSARSHLLSLQGYLEEAKIQSTIPGLVDQSWKFCEPDSVTLSTVFRAKGNEAPIIYIICFDSLYSYLDEIGARNRAFTSISRSKGFVRITGKGKQMVSASKEIKQVLADAPCLKFPFPDMKDIRIRRLDASETSRRRKEVKKAKESLMALLGVDKEALTEVDAELKKKIKKKLEEK